MIEYAKASANNVLKIIKRMSLYSILNLILAIEIPMLNSSKGIVAPASRSIVFDAILGTGILIKCIIIIAITEYKIGFFIKILGDQLPDHIETPSVKFAIETTAKYIIEISSPTLPKANKHSVTPRFPLLTKVMGFT